MKPPLCPEWVPLFPLPNAVLLPKAILPLHVFEPRYRIMTEDALATDRTIAIALLRPGYESQYHTLEAEIHPLVGVGRILREERLPDGRFNFLLQGLVRAKIIDENHERPYRRGRVQPITAAPAQPDVECALKRRLKSLLHTEPLAALAKDANWCDLLTCPEFTLSDVVDVIASAILPKPDDKQCFLSEACVATRAECLCDVLASLNEQLRHSCATRRPRMWPPKAFEN